jgi:hypothetical protein
MKTVIFTLFISTWLNTPASPLELPAMIDLSTLTLFVIGLVSIKGARGAIRKSEEAKTK